MENNFFNSNNKKNENEELLDLIMEEHKKRENKFNINSGYLLKGRKDGKSAISVLKKSDMQDDDNKEIEIAVLPQQLNNKPMFIVSEKDKKFHSSKSNKKIKSPRKKINSKIVLWFFVAILLIAGTIGGVIYGVILNKKTMLNVTCGYLDGISLETENGKIIEKLFLKQNESANIKVVLNEGYKDSVVSVYLNDVLLVINKNGTYTITNTSNVLNLHISGVKPDKYDLTLKYGQNGKFILKNTINESAISAPTKKTLSYLEVYKFIVTIDGVTNIKEKSYSVYYKNKYIEPTKKLGFYDEYEIVANGTSDIVLQQFSPFQLFTMVEEVKDNKTEFYKITGLTTEAQKLQEISIPNFYNELPVKLMLNSSANLDNISNVYIGATSSDIIADNFDFFKNLEFINVYGKSSDAKYLEAKLGVLYLCSGSGTSKTTTCIKVPSELFKNNTLKVLNLNCNKIAKGAINNLLHANAINFQVDEIEPMAFNKVYNENNYTLNSLNSKFQVINNIIYKVLESGANKKLAVVAAPKQSGLITLSEFTTEIYSNAFSNTEITEIAFANYDKDLKLNTFSFADMKKLETITLPKGTSAISDYCFMNADSLKKINATKLTSAIKIIDTAFSLCDNLELIQIVVLDNLFDAFKALSNDAISSMFVKSSNFS